MDNIQEIIDQKERNIFICGEAGTGKSTCLRSIIDNLIISKIDHLISAPTGVAALNIEGQTLHSLLGQGLFIGSVEQLTKKMLYQNRDGFTECTKRWIDCEILIIDEISMMDVSLFVRASEVLKRVRTYAYENGYKVGGIDNLARTTDQPWGGIRLILVGDFLQIPPIQKYVEELPSPGVDQMGNPLPGEKRTYTYLFEHEIWDNLNLHVIHLTKPMRYIESTIPDIDYIGSLSDIRIGILSERAKKLIAYCSRSPSARKCTVTTTDNKTLHIIPTVLIATNKEVDKYNEDEMKKLIGEEKSFPITFKCTGKVPSISKEDMLKYSSIPEVLKLKVGCQVMLTKNMMKYNLCNGSRGVITGFNTTGNNISLPIVEFMNGKILTIDYNNKEMHRKIYAGSDEKGEWQTAILTHIPLRLAYALTVHRSQGLSLDNVHLSVSSIFGPSMLYVALSRCRSAENTFIKGWSIQVWNKSKPDPKAIAFYETLSTK